MARTWLKVEGSVSKHPKVRVFASLYGVKPQLVVGFLIDWWDFCTEFGKAGEPAKCHSDDLRDMFRDVLSISTVLVVPDVVKALRESGLMDENGDPHDWQEYAGSVLTKRAQDAQRQRLCRAAKAGKLPNGHSDVTLQSRVENKQKDIGTHTAKRPLTRLDPADVRKAWANMGQAANA